MAGIYRELITKPRHRSPLWPAVRATHLANYPYCASCHQRKLGMQVHHKVPFAVDPNKELDPSNLITGCRDCHFAVFHRRNWRKYVVNLDEVLDTVKVKKIKRGAPI